MKIVLKLMLVVSGLVLVGCGGGGGSPDDSTGSTLSYSGKTSKAVLTKENTKYFVELANMSFSNIAFDTSSLKVSKESSLHKVSQKVLGDTVPNMKVIDSDSRAGEISGKVSVVVEETGTYTGTITYTYENFSDVEMMVANGKVVNYLTVNRDEVITKSIIEYQSFNMKIQEEDITIDGKVVSAPNATGTSIVENYVVKNNKTAEMLKYENFTTGINKQGQIVRYSGKIYDSNYGYVNVSTLSPLAYNVDGTRKAEGEVLLEGKTSSTTIKYAYDNRVRVEIDADKDGTVDTVQVYQSGNYEQEIPNTAPVISISFPQSIYTDTDMSAVSVNVYDPDLDGFTTEYEWKVNGEVKGSVLALDNILFKKHDTLKLTVTATDDREKVGTQYKTQVVLNTAPVAMIESNVTEENIEALVKVGLDASASTDKDNDVLTYEWKVYKYIPETEAHGETIVETVWTDIAETIEDIDIPYVIIEVNTSKYIKEPTLEKPIFSAVAQGKHIIKCTVFDNDMAENTTELNLTIKPLDVVKDTESKVFFEGQDTLGESTFNSTIKVFDLDKDGDKELLYFTRNPENVYETLLHITYDANGASRTVSYPTSSTNIGIKDINGDGLVDIFMGNQSMFQNLQGEFENPSKYSVWSGVLKLIDDFNGDSKPDGIRLDGCTLEIYTNFDNTDEKIQYTVEGCNTENSNNALSINDFNNDGIQDYMIFSHSSYDEKGQFVIVYKHNKNNLVESEVTVVDQRVFSETMTVGDINGDGFNDVIIDFVLFENNKDLTFKKIETLGTKQNGSTNDRIVIADINNDGKEDVLYHNADVLRVLIQGDNYQMSDFEIKHVIDNVVISDIDNDGKAEVIENYQNRIGITSFK